MEREIKKIKTLSGVELELKSYLTGREVRVLQSCYLDKLNVEADEKGKTVLKNIKGSLIKEIEDAQIKAVILSVRGKNEKILDLVLDLPSVDYNFVMNEVRGVVGDQKFEEKKIA